MAVCLQTMSTRRSLTYSLALLKRHLLTKHEPMRQYTGPRAISNKRCNSTPASALLHCPVRHFLCGAYYVYKPNVNNPRISSQSAHCHHFQSRSFCQVAETESEGGSDVVEEDKHAVFVARAHALLGDTDAYLAVERWEELEQKVSQEQSRGHWSFDKIAMRHILTLRYYKMGLSLFDYLIAKELTISDEISSVFLSLCVQNEELDHLLKWYDTWRANKRVVSCQLLPTLVRGFSQTERWRESLEMLKEWDKIRSPKVMMYHSAIVAACSHEDLKVANDLLKEMNTKKMPVLEETVVHLLKTMQSKQVVDKQFDAMCEKVLLDLLSRHQSNRTYPSYDLVQKLQQWFKRRKDERWQTRLTGINSHGECRTCRARLKPLAISEAQFTELREELLEKVVKGSDVFRKTTPEELKAFMKFVDEGAPYDIIIDGLNVAMLNHAPPHKHAKQLYQCVVHLVQECGYKCLVMGRHHMTEGGKWNKHYMAGITDLADCFFTENLSKDDPFLLYATLHSGPKTRYVTSDMLRDHKALLDDENNTAFFRWQKSQQMVPLFFKHGKVVFKKIFQADVVVQRTEDSWHIPYDDGTPRFSYQQPITWLCAQRLA